MGTRLEDLRLETVILARLMVPPAVVDVDGLAAELYQDLGLSMELTCWRARVGRQVAQLQATELVLDDLRLTETGQRLALERLEMERLPAKSSWNTVRDRVLVARALGLAPNRHAKSRLRTANGLAAIVLARRLEGDLGPTPSLNQVLDALVWTALGIRTDEPLTVDRLRSAVLMGRLEPGKRSDPKRLARQLAAMVAGAEDGDVGQLRPSVLRSWLLPQSEERDTVADPLLDVPDDMNLEARTGAPSPPPSPSCSTSRSSLVPPLDLPADHVAQMALAASRRAGVDRFGPSLAFIASVHRTLIEYGHPWELERFKSSLLQAHRQGDLRLVTAQMSESMDSALVAESKASDGRHAYHLIDIDWQARSQRL